MRLDMRRWGLMDSDRIDMKNLNSLTTALNRYGENTKRVVSNMNIFYKVFYELANSNHELQIDLIKQNLNLSRIQKYRLIKKIKAQRKENRQ